MTVPDDISASLSVRPSVRLPVLPADCLSLRVVSSTLATRYQYKLYAVKYANSSIVVYGKGFN